MVINKLIMKSATFSYPWVLSDTMLGVRVAMVSGIEMVVIAAPAIDSEVVEGVAYAVEVLVAVIIGVAPAIGVDMLTANGTAAVMAPLELSFPSP